MGAYEDRAKLIWSLASAVPPQSTTISGAGNSGTWGDSPTEDYASSPVRLAPATDFQLMVWLGGKTGTPVLTVQLGYYDNLGNLFTPSALLIPNTSFTAITPPGGVVLNAGVRAGSGGTTYFVFPAYGQISWTCSGGSYTGVEMELWGR